jgi:hypothetical protein
VNTDYLGWAMLIVGVLMVLAVLVNGWLVARRPPSKPRHKYPHGTYCGLVCEGGSEARECQCAGPWQCTEGNFIPAHQIPKKRGRK